MNKRLTEKQKRFIDYYVETGNQTEAAKRAGYKQPHVQGAQNLGKLRDRIDARLQELEEKRIAGAVEVLQYLTSVMREEVSEDVVVIEGEGDGCSGARIVRKKVSVRDRNKAAELIGKRLGMFTDKLDVNLPITVVIADDYGDEPE
jgi:phage terminase small subunit